MVIGAREIRRETPPGVAELPGAFRCRSSPRGFGVAALAPAGSWSPEGGAGWQVVWDLLGVGGPLVLGLLLLALVLRGIARRSRYRAVGAFGEDDRRAVHEALAAAERRTVGEILPVVVERSDPHPAAEWLAALSAALAGSALLLPRLPWELPVVVLLCQIGLGVLGFGLARALPGFKRAFLLEDRATAVAEEQAFQEFYRQRLHETEAGTGVLLFVSLLEHRVVVLADRGIDTVVPEGFWEGVDDAILAGVRRGALREGLIDGIGRAGEALAEHFPWREGDRNEVPDRVVVRRE